MEKKVLGIGNALVDVLSNVSDDFINEIHYPKGTMQLVSWREISQIIARLSDINRSSGGSASNTVCTMAELDQKCSFIGKIGNDDFGHFYHRDMLNRNVVPHIVYGDDPTGTCCALITPDKERTLVTYLGAAALLQPQEIKPEYFKDIFMFYIEGYLIHNQSLIDKSLEYAKQSGALICLDLSSYNVVNEYRDYLKRIVVDYVDILFANEEEAKSLTGLDPDESARYLAGQCKICIVKIGKNGSYVASQDQFYHIDAFPAKVVDTTGAGDIYASGFLYSFLNDYPLATCGKIGSLMAASAVEVMGPKIGDSQWRILKEKLSQIQKNIP